MSMDDEYEYTPPKRRDREDGGEESDVSSPDSSLDDEEIRLPTRQLLATIQEEMEKMEEQDRRTTVPSGDPALQRKRTGEALEAFFQDKLKRLREGIEELDGQIEHRVYLKHKHGEQIQERIDGVEKKLDAISHWEPGYKPSCDSLRSDLEREQVNLEKEQRLEGFGYWKDVGMLRKERLSLLGEYETLVKKRELMGRSKREK